MKRFLVSAFAATLAASLAAAAVAQQVETTPIPMSPKPDFSSMQFMVGTWNCTAKSARRPTPTLSTAVTSLDSSGYWLVTKTKSKATSWFPHATNSVDSVTYDAQAKHWVDVETDDAGGYDVSTASGWDGSNMVWHDVTLSYGADIASSNATTFTKASDTKTTFASSFKTKKGRTVGVTGSCTKA